MSWFLNLSTRAKLFLSFGVLILFLAIVAGLAYKAIGGIRDAQKRLFEIDFANSYDFNTYDSIVNGERADLLTLYVLKDPSDREAAQQSLRDYAKQSRELIPKLLERNRNDPTGEIPRRLNELNALRTTFLEVRDSKILPLVLDGKLEETNKLQSEQQARFNKMRTLTAKLTSLTEQSARNSVADSAEAANQAVLVLAVVSGLALVMNVVLVYSLNRIIAIPLNKVSETAKRIAVGDLQGEKLPVLSQDEIGQLTLVFNTMLESLRNLAEKTRAVTANITAAAAEILASTQQQATSTREQAATVQQVTTTMEEVSQSGAQISNKAKQVAAAAEATSAVSNAGLQAVQETTRTMAAIREQVEEVAENIVALSEKTQAVGEIIATVNDIAERSNLLALNAAIKATAAGDQGNRFSVVANEMKNLADQAKDSTVQVRTILGDIQKGINSSVMLTEEAVKRGETGKHQADVTEQTIHQMAKTTLESVQAFEQIIGAGNQQQIGFEQVAQGMKDIRQAAGQTAAATSQLEKAVANLNVLSQELKQAVGGYKL